MIWSPEHQTPDEASVLRREPALGRADTDRVDQHEANLNGQQLKIEDSDLSKSEAHPVDTADGEHHQGEHRVQ